MRILSRGMAIALAALSLTGGGDLAAPVETVFYSFKGGSDGAVRESGQVNLTNRLVVPSVIRREK